MTMVKKAALYEFARLSTLSSHTNATLAAIYERISPINAHTNEMLPRAVICTLGLLRMSDKGDDAVGVT